MDSIKSAWRGVLLRCAFRNSKLRVMARQALEGPKPSSSTAWLYQSAIVELGSRYSVWLLSPPYWAALVNRALLAAMLLSIAAVAVAFGGLPVESVFGMSSALWMTVGLAFFAVVSAVHALGSHGPAEPITPKSYDSAWMRLRVATDDQVTARSLIQTTLLVIVLMVDGAVLGVAMAKSLGAYLTPRWAMYLAVAWGGMSAILIWELAKHAAREQRTNAARASVRLMDASSNIVERERARQFMDRVGNHIGRDLSMAAPMRKRLTLFGVVLMLAVVSVGLRVAGGGSQLSATSLTESLQEPFVYSEVAAPEFEVPPAPQPSTGRVTGKGIAPDNAAVTLWLSALVLAAVVVVSSTVLLWTLASCECIDSINSPRDRAVVERFDSSASVVAFNHAHAQNVTSALEGRLQRFAREVELAKRILSPSEARTWPPVEVRASDVLAAALQPRPTGNLVETH